MKKLFVAIAMIMTTVVAMAQSQLYVIMKDGSGTSFPEATVDSLTFNDDNGATIYGLKDLANSIAQLRKEVDELKKFIGNQSGIGNESDYQHEFVDLDLPSGTLWATCNVGAKKPEDYGILFAWGEIDSKFNYTSNNYKHDGKSASQLRAEKVIDARNNLAPDYDAASVFWGEDWRMPTATEIDELLKNCTWEWIDFNGSNGIEFTSKKNGKKIFLPCAGYFNGNDLLVVGENGYYLSSTFFDFGVTSGTLFLFKDRVFNSTMKMSHGRSVRPVKRNINDVKYLHKDSTHINGHCFVDLGLPSGRLWANDDMFELSYLPTTRYGEFKWGETKNAIRPYEDTTYLYSKYDTKEKLDSIYLIDDRMNLTPLRDVATFGWGGNWRIPTKDDYEELFKNCVATLNDEGTVLTLTGPNGKTITFESLSVGRWTSSLYIDTEAVPVNQEQITSLAWSFSLSKNKETGEWILPSEDNNYSIDGTLRLIGLRIRPISDMIIK